MIDNDPRVQIVADALRKAFRTNAFNPWDGIARQAVQALDEQYVDKDLEQRLDAITDEEHEKALLDDYIRAHELLVKYKQELWNEGYKQGRRDAAEAVRTALARSDTDQSSIHDTLIRSADGATA